VNAERFGGIIPGADIDLSKLSLWSISTNAGSICEVTLFHHGVPFSAPVKWRQKTYDGLNLIFGFNFKSLSVSMPKGLYGNNPVQIQVSEKDFKVQSTDAGNVFSLEAVYFALTLDVKPNEPL
jgi:hypothetical protein